MNRCWAWVSFALVFVGMSLVVLGQFARSDLTPVGQMDCGCGRAEECVTKHRAIHAGLILSLSGGGLLLAGLLIGGAGLARVGRESAGMPPGA
jgi:hypothetical protein